MLPSRAFALPPGYQTCTHDLLIIFTGECSCMREQTE
jgi:hypothetical protein